MQRVWLIAGLVLMLGGCATRPGAHGTQSPAAVDAPQGARALAKPGADDRQRGRNARPALSIRRRGARWIRLQRLGGICSGQRGDPLAENRSGTTARRRARRPPHDRGRGPRIHASRAQGTARGHIARCRSIHSRALHRRLSCGSIRSRRRPTPRASSRRGASSRLPANRRPRGGGTPGFGYSR